MYLPAFSVQFCSSVGPKESDWLIFDLFLITQDPKLKSLVSMGSQDALEDKTVTICYGSDFVNVNFINFCTTRAEIARLWTDHIFHLAYNLVQLNTSSTKYLQKAHTRLTLSADKNGNIPVKK